MSKRVQIVFIALCLILPSIASARTLLKIRPICGKYQIESRKPIQFNANEKMLICGDKKVGAWKNIPDKQAKYNITNFLQDRGYYYPKFRKDGDMITVEPGKITKIRGITVTGDPPETLNIRRRRRMKGYTMTPARLNKLEKWTTSELNNYGNPCAKVTVTAEAYSGEAFVDVKTGKYEDFPPVTAPTEEDKFKIGSLRRFDAFKTGKPYNLSLLNLTARRIENDGVVQNSYFVTTCQSSDIKIEQKTTLGKPRLFTFGAGVNTEEYVKGKITWKHTRIDSRGSSIKLSAIGSYRRQRVAANMQWFPFLHPVRFNFYPGAAFERRHETKYNYLKWSTFIYPNTSWDGPYMSVALATGPQLSFIKTYKGANKGFTRFLTANVGVNITSHNFEYYDYDPRAGFNFDFAGSFGTRHALSSVTAQKLKANAQWLINIGKLDPPLLVFGLRGGVSTTITKRNSSRFNALPPDYLLYLGGQDDLRGFKRQDLPITYNGALTTAFACAELRLANYLPLGIQPIIFVDFGALGQTSLNLDYPVYWSPGLGFRLHSMLGVFRFTAARGMMIKNTNPANTKVYRWQFYFGIGREF